jgi:glycosyltransferase involved in cell wall biosynthesis
MSTRPRRRNAHSYSEATAASSGLLSILHIVAPAPFGGLESVVRALATGHTRAGHSVRVAAVLSREHERAPFTDSLEADGVVVSRVVVGDRDYLGERRAIRRLCGLDRPDIIHTHGSRPDVVDGGVGRREGSGVVSTCHGFIDGSVRGRLYRWIQYRALRKFDAVCAVSAPIANRLRAAGVPSGKIHLLPNVFAPNRAIYPREDSRRRLDAPDGPLVGWVGRLSREKGADIALEAFARLARPDVRLVVIGAGPDEDSLRQRAIRLGIAHRVMWRGAMADAGLLFAGFDVFLLSSRTEGTPVSLLEAMAAGVPIVATRVGGVPDVVDAACALLVASEDVEGMTSALALVLDEPQLAWKRAERARARLTAEASTDSWLSRYESIYRQVLRGRARAVRTS